MRHYAPYTSRPLTLFGDVFPRFGNNKVGTNRGFATPHARAQEVVYQSNSLYSFQNDEILCFAADKSGMLWMGGREKGLHLYDRKTGRLYNCTYEPSKEGSLSDKRVNCIFKDAQGRMWLGTNKGLCISAPVSISSGLHKLFLIAPIVRGLHDDAWFAAIASSVLFSIINKACNRHMGKVYLFIRYCCNAAYKIIRCNGNPNT